MGYGRVRRLGYLTSSCALAITWACTAAAQGGVATEQTTSSEQVEAETDIGEIVVTANKREQNLSDIGFSVTAVSGDELRNQRISSGEDLALSLPQLEFAKSSNNTPVYTLRAIGFNDASLASYPDVSLYLDQAPLPFPVMASRTVFDLERVEVLKGPQGTLFGNNATGGAINFVAAKPTDSLSAGAEFGYGRFNTFDVGGFVSGPLSDTVQARFAVKAVNGDEWQKSFTRNDSLGKQDNIAARLLVDWQPVDRLKLSLNLNGWRDQDDPQATQIYRLDIKNPPGSAGAGGVVPSDLPVLTTPIAPIGNLRAADWSPNLRPFTDNKFYQASLRADYDVTDSITLTSLTSHSDLKFLNTADEDGSELVIFSFVNHRGRLKSLSQELRLAGTTPTFRWVVGGNYERSNVGEIADQPSFDGSSPAVNGFSTVVIDNYQRLRNYAAFANAEYDLGDLITLKAGVRQSKADRATSNASYSAAGVAAPPGALYTANEFFNIVYGSIYGGVVPLIREGESFSLDTRTNADGTPVDPSTYLTATRFFGKLSEDSTSWSGGIDVKPTDDLLLYANVSKGFKSGSFPYIAAAIFEGYAPVTQESLINYEAGFKAQLADKRLSINGSAFFYDYRNKQLRTKFIDPIFGALDKLQNVPKSSVKGLELEISGRPTDGLSITATGSYIDAEVKRYTGTVGSTLLANGLRSPVFASFEGASLPFAPKWQYSLRADHVSAISDALDMFVGVGVNGQSKSFSSLAITALDFSDFRMPGYSIVGGNIGIGSSDGSWRAGLWAKNIFNKFYLTNRYASYDTNVQTTGRPVEYGLSVAFRY